MCNPLQGDASQYIRRDGAFFRRKDHSVEQLGVPILMKHGTL